MRGTEQIAIVTVPFEAAQRSVTRQHSEAPAVALASHYARSEAKQPVIPIEASQ
jgi:hypothetical protein